MQSKRDRIIYRVATGLVCGVMAFSAINFNLTHPFGPWDAPFVHLGLPDYIRIELSVAKALGVLALLIPAVPRKVKEFAYFGFAVTLISASVAHFASGDATTFVVDPLLFFGALAVSYAYSGLFDRQDWHVQPARALDDHAGTSHANATTGNAMVGR